MQTIEQEASPLQREMAWLTRRLAVIGIALCLLLTILHVFSLGGWLAGLLAGIVLAMGILPQEFPVILIVFLALGARRIARQRVLARRLGAIETLGETTVLCVDKTGTLTQNRMAVAALALLDDDFCAIVQAIRLGRRIFANLRQTMIYTLAVHVPIIGLSIIFSSRSTSAGSKHIISGTNRVSYWVLGGTVLGLLAITGVPMPANPFGFTPIGWELWLTAFGIGACTFVLYETVKLVFSKTSTSTG